MDDDDCLLAVWFVARGVNVSFESNVFVLRVDLFSSVSGCVAHRLIAFADGPLANSEHQRRGGRPLARSRGRGRLVHREECASAGCLRVRVERSLRLRLRLGRIRHAGSATSGIGAARCRRLRIARRRARIAGRARALAEFDRNLRLGVGVGVLLSGETEAVAVAAPHAAVAAGQPLAQRVYYEREKPAAGDDEREQQYAHEQVAPATATAHLAQRERRHTPVHVLARTRAPEHNHAVQLRDEKETHLVKYIV